ncbi:MAG: hypothetical protein P4L31_08180 [Candidatus Babeliales bacterium]|nr:hypothetical protein [Candidatus Babeliales bacterium]
MKKITLISTCLLSFFINESRASGSRFSRIVVRGLHSSALRARGTESYDLQSSRAREHERRLDALRVKLSERAKEDRQELLGLLKRNTELMNIEINQLRAQIQRLDDNQQGITHRNTIGAVDKTNCGK